MLCVARRDGGLRIRRAARRAARPGPAPPVRAAARPVLVAARGCRTRSSSRRGAVLRRARWPPRAGQPEPGSRGDRGSAGPGAAGCSSSTVAGPAGAGLLGRPVGRSATCSDVRRPGRLIRARRDLARLVADERGTRVGRHPRGGLLALAFRKLLHLDQLGAPLLGAHQRRDRPPRPAAPARPPRADPRRWPAWPGRCAPRPGPPPPPTWCARCRAPWPPATARRPARRSTSRATPRRAGSPRRPRRPRPAPGAGTRPGRPAGGLHGGHRGVQVDELGNRLGIDLGLPRRQHRATSDRRNRCPIPPAGDRQAGRPTR